ncbi:MAG: glycerate dehydrogenase [Acidimicrobiales bacterium]|nr:MAG: glycerate dehydrogenase [Acidimicrobiales bacterium]
MTRPAVLIAHMEGLHPFDNAALDRLERAGRLLDREPLSSWDGARADELLAEAEIIVGHWGTPTITADVLARAPKLQMFAYAAGTIKWSMSDDAWDARDLVVTSGASANAEPVAEYTLAMILLANKRVFPAVDLMRDRATWAVPATAREHGNWDKTIGLVSASLIGRRVAEMLAPFPHLRVEIYDPFVDAAAIESLGATKADDLLDLCRRADVLSIHAPALPATHNLIGADHLAALPDGATVINTSRGHCLDLDALMAELESGRLFAIIDVTDPLEPLPEDHALRHLPNAVYTPHLAGSQGTELARMADWVCDEVERFVEGRPQRNRITHDMIDKIA